MDQAEFIRSVRNKVAEGEVDAAFEQLTAYLSDKPAFRSLYLDTLQAQAQYNKASQEATMGVVSSEQAKLQFNQSTRRLLHLLERMEKGPAQSTKRSYLLPAIAVVAGLAILGAGIWWWLKSETPSAEVPLSIDKDCPKFTENSIFNILLLPFISLDESIRKPHIAIASNLSELRGRYNISFDVKTYDLTPDKSNAFLATNDDAEALGKNCSAQLIIWGTSEAVDADSTLLQTRYKFLNTSSTLPLNKLRLTEGTNTDLVSSISSISTEGLVTSSIEESILLLFGLIAHETGNQQAAIASLQAFHPSDSASSLVSGMVLAENYLAMNMNEQAAETYDQVLELHPEYALARNNRGILNFVKGNYQEASEDLTVALEKDKENAMLLEARGFSYLQIEHLKEAREDFQEIKRIKGEDTQATQRIKEIDKKIEAERTIKARAESVLRRNPSDLSALMQKAESSKKIGAYDDSINASRSVLSKDPDNAAAYANLLDVYFMKRDTQMVREVILKAKQSSVDLNEVGRLVPYQLERATMPRRVIRPRQ